MIHRRKVLLVAGDFRGHLGKGEQILRNRLVVLIEEFQPFFANLFQLLSLLRAWPASDAAQRRRVEVVVGKNEVAKSLLIEFICFIDNPAGKALPWLASVRYPYRTEAAILWQPATV